LKANDGIFPFDDPLNGEHLKLTTTTSISPAPLTATAFFPT